MLEILNKATNADIKDLVVDKKELEKYECEKSTEFFSKLNDSERNEQIRRIAFNHLQSIGKYVKLRKKFDGKKKQYMIEKTEFDMKPFDLLEKIEKDTIQNKKSFDYFISHSFMDNNLVMIIKKHFNQLNYHIYCDWLSDTDFLKRKYAGEYTKIILKKRIEQSNKILFLRTNNTQDERNNYFSEWVQMEIEYANKLNKEQHKVRRQSLLPTFIVYYIQYIVCYIVIPLFFDISYLSRRLVENFFKLICKMIR